MSSILINDGVCNPWLEHIALTMGYNVRLEPSGVCFTADEGVSILESAIGSNIYLEHSCMDGSCGSCKARLIQGDVSPLLSSTCLTDAEVKDGYILTCCSKADSGLVLKANYYPELASIKKMVQPCKVESLDFPSPDTAILKLKMPPTAKFKFIAGQFVKLMMKGARRSYSIANIEQSYQGIELHIRRVVGGLFSEVIFNELKIGQLLRIEGPFGSFFVREGKSPIIFLAGGTGFAPVKSMVEQLIEDKTEREVLVYWGSSTLDGFYSDVANDWQKANSNVRFIPVYSGSEGHTGRKGLVHQAVLEDIKDIEKYEVYACGALSMIEAARKDFVNNGLMEDNFYSDAFVSSD